MQGIEKAITDLQTLNEKIREAEKSHDGWKTVQEDLSDSTASNLDDEWKLRTLEPRNLGKNKT